MPRNTRIASPCRASWEKMQGDDRVRHCAECNLNVYNFAAMTTAEVEELIANREGRLCARLYQRADGTLITQDCPVGFQVKVRHVSRVAGVALAAAAIAVPLSAAQTGSAPGSPSLAQIHRNLQTIVVQVTNRAGVKLHQAGVSLTDANGHELAAGETDNLGNWGKSEIAPGRYVMTVQYPGATPMRQTVTVLPDEALIVHVIVPVATPEATDAEEVTIPAAAMDSFITLGTVDRDDLNPDVLTLLSIGPAPHSSGRPGLFKRFLSGLGHKLGL